MALYQPGDGPGLGGGVISSLAKFMQSPAGVAQRTATPNYQALGGGNPQTVNSIIPDPSVYEGETASALQAYNQALANIAQRRSTTLQNYGFTGHVNPDGTMSNYSIDPNNQYGAIQQLLGGEGNNLHQLFQAATQRGIGHIGLGAQAGNQYRFQAGGEQANLGSQFVNEIGGEAADQFNATSAYNAAKLQAQRDAIASAIQNQMFTPAVAPTTSPTPGPKPTQAKTSVAGKATNPYQLARQFGGGSI